MHWIINLCKFLHYFHLYLGVPWWGEPLLHDERRFSDSSFSASASSKGHGASNARISSGSSWCAPLSLDRHYLQVDFGRHYYIHTMVTYGDSNSSRWVASYDLNVTDDWIHWKYKSFWVRKNDAVIAVSRH
jgi:hypothetical protein